MTIEVLLFDLGKVLLDPDPHYCCRRFIPGRRRTRIGRSSIWPPGSRRAAHSRHRPTQQFGQVAGETEFIPLPGK
jgi:hypothetical protein